MFPLSCSALTGFYNPYQTSILSFQCRYNNHPVCYTRSTYKVKPVGIHIQHIICSDVSNIWDMNKLFIAKEYVFGIFISYSPSNNISAGITLKIWKRRKYFLHYFQLCYMENSSIVTTAEVNTAHPHSLYTYCTWLQTKLVLRCRRKYEMLLIPNFSPCGKMHNSTSLPHQKNCEKFVMWILSELHIFIENVLPDLYNEVHIAWLIEKELFVI